MTYHTSALSTAAQDLWHTFAGHLWEGNDEIIAVLATKLATPCEAARCVRYGGHDIMVPRLLTPGPDAEIIDLKTAWESRVTELFAIFREHLPAADVSYLQEDLRFHRDQLG